MCILSSFYSTLSLKGTVLLQEKIGATVSACTGSWNAAGDGCGSARPAQQGLATAVCLWKKAKLSGRLCRALWSMGRLASTWKIKPFLYELYIHSAACANAFHAYHRDAVRNPTLFFKFKVAPWKAELIRSDFRYHTGIARLHVSPCTTALGAHLFFEASAPGPLPVPSSPSLVCQFAHFHCAPQGFFPTPLNQSIHSCLFSFPWLSKCLFAIVESSFPWEIRVKPNTPAEKLRHHGKPHMFCLKRRMKKFFSVLQ